MTGVTRWLSDVCTVVYYIVHVMYQGNYVLILLYSILMHKAISSAVAHIKM